MESPHPYIGHFYFYQIILIDVFALEHLCTEGNEKKGINKMREKS